MGFFLTLQNIEYKPNPDWYDDPEKAAAAWRTVSDWAETTQYGWMDRVDVELEIA